VIKGQAHGDFLAAHLVPKNLKMHEDIPDEVIEANMTMFFDWASRTGPKGKIVVGVGAVFLSRHNHVLSYVFLLTKPCSNNVVEYIALLVGLQLARQMRV